MSKKTPIIPGFNAVTDEIFVREEETPEEPPADHPQAVIIYGWGDGLPKHVAKYAEGYRVLFPHSRQIVVLGPMMKIMFTGTEGRKKEAAAIIDSLDSLLGDRKSSVLVHAMSNTGAIGHGTMINAFRDRNPDEAFPHQLLVLDSTPGSPFLTRRTLTNWSYAMSLGTAPWMPWPFVVTQGIWAAVLALSTGWQYLTGMEPAGEFALRVVDDEVFQTKDAKRLYLYSKEDKLISYEDVEGYLAESRAKGYECRAEVFEGSDHVGHMRAHPEQYWGSIKDAWKWSSK
ncbi:hypothetical protein ACJ41O_005551 [Fusarium nematophilum]